MKKLLIYCILFFLSQLVYSQVTITIEIVADGNSLNTDADALQEGDVEWTVTNKASKCVVAQEEAYRKGTFLGGGTEAGMTFLMIDMNIFDECRTANTGDTLFFDMKVVNPTSKYFGYTAKRFYLVPPGSIEDIFVGEDAINFVGAPKIDIEISPLAGLQICQGATSNNTLKATVRNADPGYTVTWVKDDGSAITGLSTSGANGETANFTNVAAGTFNVVAKVGAVSSAAVPVTVKPLPAKPQLAISPASVCAGEEVTVKVQNEETGVIYAWSQTPKVDNGTSAVYDAVSASVLYSVTPTLNGCTGKKSNEVNATLKPQISNQNPIIACKVDHYEAAVTMNGTGTFGAYTDRACTTPVVDASWAVPGNTVTFTKLDFGEHIFYIKGDQTCGVAEVKVNDNGSCACGAHFAIAMNDGSEFCEGTTAKPITITLTKTAEFKSASFQLKDPDGVVVMDKVKEVVGGATKTWTHTPTKSGTYLLEGFAAFDADGNNCGELDGAGSVTVTIHPKPTLQSFTVSKTEGCYDEDLVLEAVAANGTGTYQYIWTGIGAAGTGGTVNMKVQPGDNVYQVQAKDAKGCFSDVSEEKHVLGHRVVVTASAAPQSVTNGTASTLGCAVTLTPSNNSEVTEYSWSPKAMLDGGVDNIQGPKTINLTADQEYTVIVKDNHGCEGQAKTKVTVKGGVLAVTATGGEACYGLDIQLGCVPSGGAGDGALNKYDYLWKPSEGLVLTDLRIPDPKVDETTIPGNYTATVTISDGHNEVTSEVVNVVVKPQPKLTNISATPSSGTNTVTANLRVDVAPDTANLAWLPGDKIADGVNTNNATTQLLTESQTFMVRASIGDCFDEKTVDVTVVTKEIKLTATGSEGCANSQLTVEATPTGGVPGTSGYIYKWGASTPAGIVLSSTTAQKATIQNSAGLKPGVYRIPVEVTDSKNQKATADAVVTVYGAVVAEGVGICKDAETFDGQITLSNGIAPYTIYKDAGATEQVTDLTWNEDQTIATLEGLTAGKAYSYYVKDQHNCNTARVDLTADCACGAQLVLTMSEQQCALSGEDIVITMHASGGTTYSFDLVNVELGTKVLEVNNEEETTWRYQVKYADRGKYRIDNFVAVTETSKPGTCEGNVVPKEVEVKFFPTPRVEAGEDIFACGTEKVTLKGNGDAGLVYTWDHDVADGVPFDPVMGVPTTYTLRGTDAHGCWKEDQIVVTANFKPTVSAMASPNVVCKGGVVTLSHNGTADTYVWNNNGQDGANNVPEATTRYMVTGTANATGCSDTSSVLVIVNLPAEIVERPKDRTIAIGKNVSYTVKAIGNNLTYEWLWCNPATNVWTAFTDNASTTPKVSGATTTALVLEEVPQAWDGRKVKCVVKGDCGDPVEAEANLWVKECFDIVADLQMGEGIIPETTPGSAVDGWYCKGTRIALKALVNLADPEYGMVANPHYTWTIDGLPSTKVIESDSSLLTWVPEYYEDDIVVRVCVYSDGACDEACSKHIRLKARTPDNVRMQIVTSADPDRKFCPGDTLDFTVALENEGRNSAIHWYRDIFDKGIGLKKTMVMDQKDTWVKAVFEPSAEMCVERAISDSVFLQVKEYVNPTLRIENNIHDTIACQGDTLIFHAIWTDAGENPQLTWQQDIWPRGYGEYATIDISDKDTWVKCILTPGNDVCYTGPVLLDTMVVRVRESGTLSIAADMTDKHPGDELVFESRVDGMTGNWGYNWYVNGNQTICEEDTYVTDLLRQGDIVQAAISGREVCQNKVFSNKIAVDYAGYINRDTMLVIYANEKVTDLDMVKTGDDILKVLFRVETPALYGMASFTPDGKFNYIPNTGFIGTDYVKYVVMNKLDKTVVAEGYIYITVKDDKRFLIPNLITPNDDGLNDTWKLDFLSEYPNHRITIFDRNGHVVLESKNYQNDWDGTGYNKGGYVARTNLLNGVYTYVLELGDEKKTVLKSWIEIRANMNRSSYR